MGGGDGADVRVAVGTWDVNIDGYMLGDDDDANVTGIDEDVLRSKTTAVGELLIAQITSPLRTCP